MLLLISSVVDRSHCTALVVCALLGRSTHFFGQGALDAERSTDAAAKLNVLGHPKVLLVLPVVLLDGLKADVHVRGELLEGSEAEDKSRSSHAVGLVRQQTKTLLVLDTSLTLEMREGGAGRKGKAERGGEGRGGSRTVYIPLPPETMLNVSNGSKCMKIG